MEQLLAAIFQHHNESPLHPHCAWANVFQAYLSRHCAMCNATIKFSRMTAGICTFSVCCLLVLLRATVEGLLNIVQEIQGHRSSILGQFVSMQPKRLHHLLHPFSVLVIDIVGRALTKQWSSERTLCFYHIGDCCSGSGHAEQIMWPLESICGELMWCS